MVLSTTRQKACRACCLEVPEIRPLRPCVSDLDIFQDLQTPPVIEHTVPRPSPDADHTFVQASLLDLPAVARKAPREGAEGKRRWVGLQKCFVPQSRADRTPGFASLGV